MPATKTPNRTARPTVARAYSLVNQLSAAQYERLMLKLNDRVEARFQAAAQRVHARIEAAGVVITEADVEAEVQAVRASRYAAQR